MIKEMVIKARLSHDPLFLKLCLIKLYSQQEEDEQLIGETRHDNGIGFNKADASVLTPIARDMVLESVGSGIPPENITITHTAMMECRRRLPKYIGQIMQLLTEEEML